MITKAKEQIEKLRHEPGWLTGSRLKAWERYEGIPVPTLHDEQWRHTDLSKLDLSKLTKNDVDARAAESINEEIPAAGYSLKDGWVSRLLKLFKSASMVSYHDPAHILVNLNSDARSKGVVITNLAAACREHAELVHRYVEVEAAQPKVFDQDKFFMLNTALFDESIFVYVPPNVKLVDPLICAFELSGSNSSSFPRLVVVADEGSEFKFINVLTAAGVEVDTTYGDKNNDNDRLFAAGVIQLAIGSNANVSYLEVQHFNAQTTAITRTINQISADAQFNCLTVATGGSIVRSDILTELKAPGGVAKILGIVLGSGNEHYDFNTIVDHEAPNTNSDINFRVALQDGSSSVYQGTIKVDKQAQRTLAYQSNKNLLLSDRAHAASIPKLEILANDVKCSHGATVAAVDKDQVFYLSSRGLNQTQAEQLIVSGFLNQVVESFGWAQVVSWLESMLEEKLKLGAQSIKDQI